MGSHRYFRDKTGIGVKGSLEKAGGQWGTGKLKVCAKWEAKGLQERKASVCWNRPSVAPECLRGKGGDGLSGDGRRGEKAASCSQGRKSGSEQ